LKKLILGFFGQKWAKPTVFKNREQKELLLKKNAF
jgi:hypothetical protein